MGNLCNLYFKNFFVSIFICSTAGWSYGFTFIKRARSIVSNTKNVKIAGHPLKKVNTYRPDKTFESMKTEDVLKNAPQRNKNFFKIKKVLDK